MITTATSPVLPIQDPVPSVKGSARLTSMDAYRGLVMLLIMGELLEFCRVSRAIPGNGFWAFLCHHQSHAPWTGCSLHDLIQPSFSFLVGVAMPFSLASRKARGESLGRMTVHALWRALVLVLLGVFLRSTSRSQTYWTFEDTLSQIGLGYGVLFFLGLRPTRDRWIAFGVLLVGYWAAFALYPLPGPGFDYTAVGVPKEWPWLQTGFAAHWNKNSNFAWAFDTWFLNLFPREHRFLFNDGGYSTLSFIPTLATMVLGLIVGERLRGPGPAMEKVRWLVIGGVAGLATGACLGWLGICPVVKRIWTPSWTLYSGGWCCLIMAGFYLVIDVWGKKAWAFPLVVVGMNSIAAYCSDHLFDDFFSKNLTTHLGSSFFAFLGPAYEPLLHGAATLLVAWLILFWMYRRKIFLRI
jgi:heparan-alpha-glucosaminide N-acetyltransferase